MLYRESANTLAEAFLTSLAQNAVFLPGTPRAGSRKPQGMGKFDTKYQGHTLDTRSGFGVSLWTPEIECDIVHWLHVTRESIKSLL